MTGYRQSSNRKLPQLALGKLSAAEGSRTVRGTTQMTVFKHLKSIFHRVLRRSLLTSEPHSSQHLSQLSLAQDLRAAERRELRKTLKKELHSTQVLARKPKPQQVQAIFSRDVNMPSKRMSTTRESSTAYSSKSSVTMSAGSRSGKMHGGHDFLEPSQVKVIAMTTQSYSKHWRRWW